MRNCIIFTLAFIILLDVAAGGKSKDCVYRNHSFNIGDTFTPIGECMQWTCDGVGVLSGVSCATVRRREKGCKLLKTDRTKPYPKCCPRFEC